MNALHLHEAKDLLNEYDERFEKSSYGEDFSIMIARAHALAAVAQAEALERIANALADPPAKWVPVEDGSYNVDSESGIEVERKGTVLTTRWYGDSVGIPLPPILRLCRRVND